MFTPIEISERKALANEMAIICRHNFRIEQRHFHVHEIHFRVLTLNELQAEKKIQCKNFRWSDIVAINVLTLDTHPHPNNR